MRAAFILFLLHISVLLSAQRICGTSDITHRGSGSGVSVQQNTIPPRDTVPGEIITIPVVIHVLYDNDLENISEAQILSQIKVLNDDFRMLNADAANTPEAFRNLSSDTRIMFCLAQVDPSGRPSKGIVRRQTNIANFMGNEAMKFTAAGGSDAWDTKQYLNIWVCSLFGRSLGYATFPGSPADKDGVVINYDVFGTTGFVRAPFNKGRTATHEVAHWMGLKHIWGDDNCGDDEVYDTPSQRSYNFSCPSFPHLSSCSPNANGDLFMNFMDLTDDACMNMFTHGQKSKMRSVFAINNLRNGILSSYACDSSMATGAPLPEEIPSAQIIADIKVYPNPVVNFLTVEPVNGFELNGNEYSLFSVEGKKLKHGMIKGEQAKIDMSGITPGIYLLHFKKGDFRKIYKIIKL